MPDGARGPENTVACRGRVASPPYTVQAPATARGTLAGDHPAAPENRKRRPGGDRPYGLECRDG